MNISVNRFQIYMYLMFILFWKWKYDPRYSNRYPSLPEIFFLNCKHTNARLSIAPFRCGQTTDIFEKNSIRPAKTDLTLNYRHCHIDCRIRRRSRDKLLVGYCYIQGRVSAIHLYNIVQINFLNLTFLIIMERGYPPLFCFSGQLIILIKISKNL